MRGMDFPENPQQGDMWAPSAEGPLMVYMNGEWLEAWDENEPPFGVRLLDQSTGRVYVRTAKGWESQAAPSI